VDDVEALRRAVEAQARALTTGDLAQFAAYVTPAALAQFYRARKIENVRRFELAELHADGSPARSVVRFGRGGGYELHATWERTRAGWKATSLSVAGQPDAATWWRRVLGRGGVAKPPEREDLS
jgi:hypothetical protein